MSVLIAPSILSADFAKFGEDVKALDAAGADWMHVDVMDGHFVPNISFGADVVRAIRPYTTKPLDVHLMIAPVDTYLESFAKAGANRLTIHAEAGTHLHRSLQTIRSLGISAGVALNPATPIDELDHVLDLVDLVLIMTVNPGFGGQSYIPSSEKIAAAKHRIAQQKHKIYLQVDGGITPETAIQARSAGADVLVAGSSVFKGKGSLTENIAALKG